MVLVLPDLHGATKSPQKRGGSVDEHLNDLTGWILAAIASAFSVLSGIIAMFFKKQVDGYETQIKELKEQNINLEARADLCESEREVIRIEHAVLKAQHSMLEKRVSSLEVNKKNRDSIG